MNFVVLVMLSRFSCCVVVEMLTIFGEDDVFTSDSRQFLVESSQVKR